MLEILTASIRIRNRLLVADRAGEEWATRPHQLATSVSNDAYYEVKRGTAALGHVICDRSSRKSQNLELHGHRDRPRLAAGRPRKPLVASLYVDAILSGTPSANGINSVVVGSGVNRVSI